MHYLLSNSVKFMGIPLLLLIFQGEVFAQNVRLLYHEGELFVKNQEQQFIPLQEDKITDSSTLRVGESEELQISEDVLTEQVLSSLKQAVIVLSYSNREMLTFLKGSTLVRTIGYDRIPAYSLSGIGHIFIDEATDLEPFEFRVNNLHLQANRKTHLFFNSLVVPPELILIQGGIFELPYDSEPAEEQIPLTLKKEGALPAISQQTLVPGFFTPGAYHHAGTADVTPGTLTLYRYGQKYEMSGTSIPLMLYDTIESGPDQTITMVLISGDQIRLFGNSRFTIAEIEEKEKTPRSLLDKLWKSMFQTGKEYSLNADFSGRVQATVKPRTVKNIVRFDSATATIGVKGTEFVAVSTPALTEIATISGTLLVSDPDGAGVVEVTQGMMTKVIKGTLPILPIPTPPEFLQASTGLSPVGKPSEKTLKAEETSLPENVKNHLPWALIDPIILQGGITEEEQKQYYKTLYGTVSQKYNVISQERFQEALTILNQAYEQPRFKQCQSSECLERLKKALAVTEVFIFSALRKTGDTRINFKRLNTKKVYTNLCEICLPREINRRIPYIVGQLLQDLEREPPVSEP
ncbi:hypothetical protein WDW89_14250 [Deltaproteobacteria bacterium TL4]